VVFFVGLRATVDRLARTRHPTLWASLSLAVRLGIVVAGLLYLGSGDWRRLTAVLIGIVMVRTVMAYRIRRQQAREGIRRDHQP